MRLVDRKKTIQFANPSYWCEFEKYRIEKNALIFRWCPICLRIISLERNYPLCQQPIVAENPICARELTSSRSIVLREASPPFDFLVNLHCLAFASFEVLRVCYWERCSIVDLSLSFLTLREAVKMLDHSPNKSTSPQDRRQYKPAITIFP